MFDSQGHYYLHFEALHHNFGLQIQNKRLQWGNDTRFTQICYTHDLGRWIASSSLKNYSLDKLSTWKSSMLNLNLNLISPRFDPASFGARFLFATGCVISFLGFYNTHKWCLLFVIFFWVKILSIENIQQHLQIHIMLKEEYYIYITYTIL